MAFNDLLPIQSVSFTDAQTGGFALRSGQSHVTSVKCMSKDEAQAKYVLNAPAMNAYTGVQNPPKSSWVSGVIGNSFVLEKGDHGDNATCAFHTAPFTLYSTSTEFQIPMRFFEDIGLTIPYYSNTRVHYRAVSNQLVTIDLDGYATAIQNCTNSYQYVGQRGALSCVGGQVALFNPVTVTVYSASFPLFIGARLFNDSNLTSPYTRGQIVKVSNQLYEMDSNGFITLYYDVGDPC